VIDWRLVEDSFRNKAGIQGLKYLEYLINENLVAVHDDMQSPLFIDKLVESKNNEMIWDTIMKFFPLNDEPLSDEQEEMAAWAHAIRQQ